ncbi:MAG: NAD(P)-binding domain-containing protein, partial [Microbacteriaceae bacterium]|nr:NAD(P)-binding domain-containing protein [Microbacteriaceae bacterium]
MNPTRLGVGVIGAGKVGPVFAQALAGAGHALVGITKPSDGDTDRLHAVVPGVALKEPLEIIALSELVIIAIPDSEVAGFVEGVSKA